MLSAGLVHSLPQSHQAETDLGQVLEEPSTQEPGPTCVCAHMEVSVPGHVCLCMGVLRFVHVCAYRCEGTDVSLCTYALVSMGMFRCTHTCVGVHRCGHASGIGMYACVYLRVHICGCEHVFTCIHIDVCTRVCVHECGCVYGM